MTEPFTVHASYAAQLAAEPFVVQGDHGHGAWGTYSRRNTLPKAIARMEYAKEKWPAHEWRIRYWNGEKFVDPNPVWEEA